MISDVINVTAQRDIYFDKQKKVRSKMLRH